MAPASPRTEEVIRHSEKKGKNVTTKSAAPQSHSNRSVQIPKLLYRFGPLIGVLFFLPLAARAKDVPAQIRVNQVGYETGQSGRAYLMVGGRTDGSKFSVMDAQGKASPAVNGSITIRLPKLGIAEKQESAVGAHISETSLSDEVLMAEVCLGRREALAILFRPYARLVRGVALRVLKDASEADDLLQDVFSFIASAEPSTVQKPQLSSGFCK
jgi:hypothetical protein